LTIYSALLGENFQKLHPKLQDRYALPLNQPFHAKGVMHQIQNGNKLLYPFYHLAAKTNFLFPESGENIPFTLMNRCIINHNKEAEVEWVRTFQLPGVLRKFNAKMTIDPQKQIVKDYLGDLSFLYSDLLFSITEEGFLMINSGEQRIRIGKREIPIPKMLRGRVTVLEGYDEDKGVYTIHVSIYSDLVGRIMMYAGEFREAVD